MTNNTGDTQDTSDFKICGGPKGVCAKCGEFFPKYDDAGNIIPCTEDSWKKLAEDSINEIARLRADKGCSEICGETDTNGNPLCCKNKSRAHPEPTGDRVAAIDLNNGVREKLEAEYELADIEETEYAEGYCAGLSKALALLAGDE